MVKISLELFVRLNFVMEYSTNARSESVSGISDFAPKWARLVPNGTKNTGLFKIEFNIFWLVSALLGQNVPKMICESPGLLRFGANLTHFGVKSDIPCLHVTGVRNEKKATNINKKLETMKNKPCH